MLLHKAWLQSRARFLCGIGALAALSILYVRLHPILIPQWQIALRNPHAIKPGWLPLGVADYRFYIWHFLYDYQLQNLWVVFAILLGFGGLLREQANGTVFFSLSLPVSRTGWFASRSAIAFLESFALACVPAIVVPVASRLIGQRYPVSQGIGHSFVMAAGGSVFVAIAALMSLLLRGDLAPIVVTLAFVTLPYLILQEWTRTHPNSWATAADAAHVMAAPWLLTWSNAPWLGILTNGLAAAVLLLLATMRGRRLEF